MATVKKMFMPKDDSLNAIDLSQAKFETAVTGVVLLGIIISALI